MTAPDVNADVRARFEAEFSKPPFEFAMNRFGASSAWPGDYRDYSVQCAWEGYRAAHADMAGEVRDSHDFKNFHRLLCERFGYAHDEIEWRRDQLSLIEHIAKFHPTHQEKP